MNVLQELMLELNALQDCEENPFPTSGDWRFACESDGDIHQIKVNCILIYAYDPEQGEMTRCALLEEIVSEMECWENCLKSTLWAVRKILQEERANIPRVANRSAAVRSKDEYLILSQKDIDELRGLLEYFAGASYEPTSFNSNAIAGTRRLLEELLDRRR